MKILETVILRTHLDLKYRVAARMKEKLESKVSRKLNLKQKWYIYGLRK